MRKSKGLLFNTEEASEQIEITIDLLKTVMGGYINA